ncbi:hypothetical protein [Paenibacillus sp. Y412MC10]|uniref:hypothetical protein n=1 Tax=Geobacillus sp. (strain Y412MC10) TaxID=481743 RepID=UPI001642DB92|nr:hypothetical protein [Paenibacillus sp. Y412MC10]
MKLASCNKEKSWTLKEGMQWDAWTFGVRLFFCFLAEKVGMISLPQAVFSI